MSFPGQPHVARLQRAILLLCTLVNARGHRPHSMRDVIYINASEIVRGLNKRIGRSPVLVILSSNLCRRETRTGL